MMANADLKRPKVRLSAGLERVVAWHVFDGDPSESSMLVFAMTPARARYMAHRHGTWEYEEYIYIRARRAPRFDGYFTSEKIVDTNDELPAGAPRFYDDEAF